MRGREQQINPNEKLATNINYIVKIFSLALLYVSYRIYTESNLSARPKTLASAITAIGSFLIYISVKFVTNMMLQIVSLKDCSRYAEEFNKEIADAEKSILTKLESLNDESLHTNT